MYLKIAPEILSRMTDNLQSENWVDLGINAHSLKPQTDFMGIPILKEKLIEIENAVKNKNTEILGRLLEEAIQIHDSASGFLQEHLQ